MIDVIQISGAASGTDGAATVSLYSPAVSGRVLAVYIDHAAAGGGAGTDFTLRDANDPAAENIVSITDSLTDVKLYPRRTVQNNAGTNLTYDGTRVVTEPYVVHGRLLAALAQANNAQTLTVTIWLQTM